MTTEMQILRQANSRGVRLTPHGTQLCVECIGKLETDFERRLVRNKAAVVRLLTARRHTARQILQGEFSILDGKIYHKLYDEMVANILDPLCRAAFARLREDIKTAPNPPRPK